MGSNNTRLILCITSSVAYFSAFFVQYLAFLFKGISWSMMATEAPVLRLESRRKEKKKRKKGYTSYLTWFFSRVSGSSMSYFHFWFFDQNLVCGLTKLQGHLGNVILKKLLLFTWNFGDCFNNSTMLIGCTPTQNVFGIKKLKLKRNILFSSAKGKE